MEKEKQISAAELEEIVAGTLHPNELSKEDQQTFEHLRQKYLTLVQLHGDDPAYKEKVNAAFMELSDFILEAGRHSDRFTEVMEK